MPDFSNQINELEKLIQISKADNLTINNFNQTASDASKHAQERVQVMPPFKPLLHPIIGRDDLIGKIIAALTTGQRSVAVLHLPGIGKTTLAAMLAKNEALLESFPDGVLWAHLGVNPDVRAELRKWAYALNVPESRMKAFETPAQWSEAVAQVIGNRRMLLIVDDVWETETAGDYFLLGGNNCAYVVTTRYPSVAARMTEVSFGVRTLDKAEGITLLRSFAPDAVDAEPIAAADLVDSVDGLPLALVLMGHYLKQAGKFKQVGRIRAALDALQDIENLFQLEQPPEYPADTPRSLASVIETSYRALGTGKAWQLKRLPGDELRRTLESLSILRADPARFRPELAERVSGIPRTALDELCDAGLIEVVHVNAEADNERYTMHRTIAEYIRTKLTSERAKDLHLCAASYYREKLNGLEAQYQQGGGYQGWYRYEDIEWQSYKDNWLYHLARTDEKRLATIAFLRAWFDGFWWWGCFLDFNFCDQLLREWRQRKVVPEAEQGLLLLSRFMAAYPKETTDRHSGDCEQDWQQVEAILNDLRQRAGIDGDATLMKDKDARHVRGLTSIFLAEAHRFGRGDYAAAQNFYRDALALFKRNEDVWDTAWTLYHLADLLCQCSEYDDAASLCLQALPLGEQEEDPEVIANVYRVLGDIERGRADFDAATRNYQLSIENAYRFQVEPEQPDSYTIRFYAQIGEQICNRLVDMQKSTPSEATRMSLALRQRWENIVLPKLGNASDLVSALRTGNIIALAACLFPPALAADALQDKGDKYAEIVKNNLLAIQPR